MQLLQPLRIAQAYTISPLFLSSYVYIQKDLEEAAKSLEVQGDERDSETGVGDRQVLQGGDTSDGHRRPCPSAPPIPELIADRHEPQRSCWISIDQYQEIKDAIALGLITPFDGLLDSSRSKVDLLARDTDQFAASQFARHLVSRIAKDLAANLIVLSKEILEDLGGEFYNQDRLQANLKKIEAPKAPSSTSESEIGDFNAPEQDSDQSQEIPPLPCERCGHRMLHLYFGAPKRPRCTNRYTKRNRTTKALDALLDADINKCGDIRDTDGSNCLRAPLFVLVEDTESIMGLCKGKRILGRIRDAISYRREAGIPVLGVFLCTGIGRLTDRDARALPNKTGKGERLHLPTSMSDPDILKEQETAQITKINIQLLQLVLQKANLDLLKYEEQCPQALWEDEAAQQLKPYLSGQRLYLLNMENVIRLACARAYGRQVDLSNIADVLRRRHMWVVSTKASEPLTMSNGSTTTTLSESRSELVNVPDISELTDLNDIERHLLGSVTKPGQSTITYDDVIIDPLAKKTIRQLLAISKFRSDPKSAGLVNALKMTGMLFYGPPGTGKTHLCRAIANDTGHTLIALTAAELESRYVSETEKTVKALFSLARKLHPCIIFLDEADDLFYKKGSDDRKWERSATNQYLHELDGINSQNTENRCPVVIVATNRPGDIDEPFLRRLSHKVYFGLPKREQRLQILEKILSSIELDADVNLKQIAKRSKAFSGSDLKTLCNQAVLSWTEQQATTNESTSVGPDWKKIRLSSENFEEAFSRTGPSTSADLMEDLFKFRGRFNPQT